MAKSFLLDTGILLASPQAINSFDEHNVYLASATIEALSELRAAHGEKGTNARESLRIIDSVMENGRHLPGGGRFGICPPPDSTGLASTWNRETKENEIIKTACEHTEFILVSNSSSVRVKAMECGVRVESYRTEQVVEPLSQYKGRSSLFVDGTIIDSLYSNGAVEFPGCNCEPQPNEYFVLTDSCNPSHSALARYSNGKLVRLHTSAPYNVSPRNAGQRFAIDALMAPPDKIPLVILKGPAGTAKTFLSMAAALEQTLGSTVYDRILVARPNIKFDEDIGFLKGTEEEKIGPLIRPVMDNLELLCKTTGEKDGLPTGSYVQDLFNRGIIVAQAMAYMRGRSIANTFILLDESQNMNPTQAFGIVSRVGVGTKVVLAGDPEQIDNPELDARNNGLSFASERMRGSQLCAQVTFEKDECVRSKLALDAITRMAAKNFSL